MDTVAWGALTLTLTAVGGLGTAWAFRRRSAVAGLRMLGLTLVPLGLLLTDSLRMVTRIVDAVGSWAGGLAWDPLTWIGLGVLGVAALCFVVAGGLRARELGGAPARPAARRTAQIPASRTPAPGAGGARDTAGDDMADIEALLRRRGIE
ncbi:cellulose synthase [Nocardioides flavescens]|uniref:Cellulose synthase n=1 Tax=Nocardioides flavescens TaxID=2691959 RepID=A0A6L7EXY3_9ACTN|nr:cellulose synthase [Nocardioides flavescens]MXG90746.1 cellulose synthase [Nocardioides flavescens]